MTLATFRQLVYFLLLMYLHVYAQHTHATRYPGILYAANYSISRG
jgi:hypothetical protein